MRGTTSPRLVLELACARVLLPGASTDEGAMLARLDRLEKRLSVSAPAAAPAPAPAAPAPAPAADVTDAPADAEPAEVAPPEASPPPSAAEVPAAAPVVAAGGVDLHALRRLWDDVLDAVKQRNRSDAQLASVDARTVTLSFNNAAIARNFDTNGKSDFFRAALREIAGIDLQVKVVSDRSPAPRSTPADRADDEPEPAVPPRPTEPSPAVVVDVTEAAGEGVSLDDEAVDTDAESADVVALMKSGFDATVIGEIDDA
jgi:DNA polymerase-3 subunit gamma/tau